MFHSKITKKLKLIDCKWQNEQLKFCFYTKIPQTSMKKEHMFAEIRNSKTKIFASDIVKNNGEVIFLFEKNQFLEKEKAIYDFFYLENNTKKRLKAIENLQEAAEYILIEKNQYLKLYSTIKDNISVCFSDIENKWEVQDVLTSEKKIQINSLIHSKTPIKFCSLELNNMRISESAPIEIQKTGAFFINKLVFNLEKDSIHGTLDIEEVQRFECICEFEDKKNEKISTIETNKKISQSTNYKDKKIFIQAHASNLELFVKKQDVSAQIFEIYAIDNVFKISGYIQNGNSYSMDSVYFLMISREKKNRCIFPLKIKNNEFEFTMNINNVKNQINTDQIWDFYITSPEFEVKLEKSDDDIRDKQKVYNIPALRISDQQNTKSYKIYYTIYNELALLIRTHVQIKKISKVIMNSNSITCYGDFFVEKPQQLLPAYFEGVFELKGYLGKKYCLSVEFKEVVQKKNSYYSAFIMELNIDFMTEEERKSFFYDLTYNLFKVTVMIDGYPNQFISKVDPKSISKKGVFNRELSVTKSNLIYKLFNNLLPISKNIAVYQSFHGKSYACSPKYIYEELEKTHRKIKGVWILDNPYTDVPKGTKIIRPKTISFYYYMARAKYFINNGNFADFYEKRPQAIHLQCWHGTPLKRLGLDIDNSSPSYLENTSPALIRRNSRWDYLIAPNEYTSNILKRAFDFKKEMINSGYPRNDIFYHDNSIKIKKIKQKLDINKDKKVILYAPTWRDEDYHGSSVSDYQLKFSLEKFKEKFGQEYVLLLRLHNRDAMRLKIDLEDNHIINASFYDDIQELYLISDLLITDYSSVMFDYANHKKPMLFFCYDFNKYKSSLRGFYFNFASNAPYPIVFDEQQLFDAIDRIDDISKVYQNRAEKFYNDFCEWEDGFSANRVIETVFKSKIVGKNDEN